MTPFLTTPRLVLRRFTRDDLPAVLALDGDPLVMRYLNGGVARTRPEIEAYMHEKLLPCWDPWCEGPRRTYFAACEKDTGRCIGWLLIRPGEYFPHELELGYRLLRDSWGKGYATEGSIAVRDHVLGPLYQRAPRLAGKLIAITMQTNTASQRVMQKIGMTYECALHEARWPGEDKRAVKYSILRAP